MPPDSLHEPRKVAEDQPNLPTNQPQEKGHGGTFGQTGFADCYIEEEAHLLIRLRRRDGQEFLACVQRDWRSGPSAELDATMRPIRKQSILAGFWLRRLFIWRKCAAAVYAANGYEQSVLVEYVQSMQEPKKVIPSLVWLDTAERFNRLLMRTIYEAEPGHFPVFGNFPYRELCLGRNDPASGHDHAAGDIIQCTAQTMQHITNDERYIGGHDGNTIEAVRYVASLRILLAPEGLYIELPPSVNNALEFVDVLLGPLTLR